MQAYIGGIVPLSTVDWQGNVCMVIFFAGCDFRCPYCYNKDLVEFKEDSLKDLKEVKQEIAKNTPFIDAVLFSGGEACLQRQALLSLARFAKEQGLKVGIETNGSKPYSIQSLLNEKLLDFVGMDLKTTLEHDSFSAVTRSTTFFRTSDEVMDGIRQTIAIVREHEKELEIEIRTTVVPGLISQPEQLEKIAHEIQGLRCRWVLQQFRPERGTLDPKLATTPSPSRESLEKLRDACSKRYPLMQIEVKAA